MAFNLAALRDAVQRHTRVVRVVVAQTRGSVPREVGAAMLIWDNGQSGTIGGGALEFEAAQAARAQTISRRMTVHALGPDLGQCCGGSVSLLSEVYTGSTMPTGDHTIIMRPVTDDLADNDPIPTRPVQHLIQSTRNNHSPLQAQLKDGWMIEPVKHLAHPLWIWGAGHVGQALINILAPLPQFDLTWVDTAPERFPLQPPAQVNILPVPGLASAVQYAPKNTAHIIVTYSHQLDFALCDNLLRHEFQFAGVIGSQTKWTRFRKRLASLGHTDVQINRINCPIGQKNLGKHPQAIAVGVACQLLLCRAPAQTNYDLMTATVR